LIFIQIDEAHTTAWPVGLLDSPPPHFSIDNRRERAQLFYDLNRNALDQLTASNRNGELPLYVDQWDNNFANTFRAWPDVYYCLDSNCTVIHKASYPSSIDLSLDNGIEALTKVDCTLLMEQFIHVVNLKRELTIELQSARNKQ